jgi:hypothetical protein
MQLAQRFYKPNAFVAAAVGNAAAIAAPTRGLYVGLSWTVSDDALESDRNFQRVDAVGLAWNPIGERV